MKNINIIIVEDEEIIAIDVKNILQRFGYSVNAIENTGAGAISKIRERRPDIVLLDITLAGDIDGIETAKQIKNEFEIPVIFLTSHADDNTLHRAKIAGPYGYIIKPINAFELHSSIETVIYRYELEKKLKESEIKYRQMFSAVSEAILMFEIESYDIIDANEAAIKQYGYSLDEFTKLKMTDISADPEKTMEYINKLQNGLFTDIALRYHKKKNGVEFPVEISSGILLLSGKKIGISASRDITKRRKFEVEMMKTQKLEAVGILAGGIAHDFNNLLTAIAGNTALAKMALDPNHEVWENLTEIENATTTAKNLSAQLSIYGKLSKPVIERISIKDLLKDSVILTMIDQKTIIEFDIPDEIWDVNVDLSQITRVIFNLIINSKEAMKEAMKEDGAIKISAENVSIDSQQMLPLADGNYVKISVEDHGIGIPKKNISKIFDPYFSTKKKYSVKGLGLGLSLVFSIIERHRGHITVESQENIGTTFSFYLPAATDR